MPDFFRFAGFTSGKSVKHARIFLKELTPKKGSVPGMARQVGYTVMFYILIMATTVITFAIFGILSFILPLVMIPIVAWLSFRLAKAACQTEDMDKNEE